MLTLKIKTRFPPWAFFLGKQRAKNKRILDYIGRISQPR